MQKKKLLQLFGLSLFIGLLCTCFFAHSLYSPIRSPHPPQFLNIPKGMHGYQVLHMLHKKNLIKSPFCTKLYLKLFPKDFRAGLYRLHPNMSTHHILHKLSSPQGSNFYKKISIPEGFSLKKIANRLESANITSANTFLNYVQKNAKSELEDTFPFLKENPLLSLEGYLFPETYYLTPSMSNKRIVTMMLQTFNKRIWPLWENAKPTKGSPKSRFNFHQVLTMASIIEKEARLSSEMPTISSVYYNRLAKKMRLQADPTVLYALGEPDKKRVLYKDLKNMNPYNTYRHFGIPPGPISSPGVSAMKASLAPKKTPYFFFVARKNGSHIFTETYKKHIHVQQRKHP